MKRFKVSCSNQIKKKLVIFSDNYVTAGICWEQPFYKKDGLELEQFLFTIFVKNDCSYAISKISVKVPEYIKKFIKYGEKVLQGASLNQNDITDSIFNIYNLWIFNHSLSLELSYEVDLERQKIRNKVFLPIPLMLYRYNKNYNHILKPQEFQSQWHDILVLEKSYKSEIYQFNDELIKNIGDIRVF